MSRPSIFRDINLERVEQDKQWGGPIHDDEHSAKDWFFFITTQVAKFDGAKKNHPTYARTILINIAALCVAAIESLDRKAIYGDKSLVPKVTKPPTLVKPAIPPSVAKPPVIAKPPVRK